MTLLSHALSFFRAHLTAEEKSASMVALVRCVVFTATLTAIVCGANGRTSLEELPTFEEFLQRYDKSYQDPKEYQFRQRIYERNCATIQRHNSNADASYWLGINPHADLEPTELARGLDKYSVRKNQLSDTNQVASAILRGRHRSLEQQHLPFVVEALETLPESVDWRTVGVTTPVSNQMQCGSCWAFASIAVLESHIALQTGRLYELSEQELVSCVPNPRQCGGTGGCAGATSELAFDFVKEKGIVEEWEYSYQSNHGNVPNCSLKERLLPGNGTSPYYNRAVASILGYIKLPSNNYQVMMNAVAKYGPVAVSVACLPWHLYKSGVFYAPLNTTEATDIGRS